MEPLDPKLVVLQFNQYINERDIDKLAPLISTDYVFIPINGASLKGREENIAGWKEFFRRYPDYRNHFEIVVSQSNCVLVAGYSTCEYEPLDGPAIWSALVVDGQVVEWRIYPDTPGNRRELGLPASDAEAG